MTEGIYYLKLGGKVEGPYSIGQIYDLWAARKINSQTLFARIEEMDKWQPLAELTLTISPPRPSIPRAPTPEPASTMQSRPRPAPSLRPEEYMPSLPQKSEPPARAPKPARGLFAPFLGKLPMRLEFGIGLCIMAGVVLAAYFMIFFPASVDGKEISQERLILKQNGVIAGIGLVLMGGLLIVARQLKQLLAAPKAEPANKSERRLPHIHS